MSVKNNNNNFNLCVLCFAVVLIFNKAEIKKKEKRRVVLCFLCDESWQHCRVHADPGASEESHMSAKKEG